MNFNIPIVDPMIARYGESGPQAHKLVGSGIDIIAGRRSYMAPLNLDSSAWLAWLGAKSLVGRPGSARLAMHWPGRACGTRRFPMMRRPTATPAQSSSDCVTFSVLARWS